MAARRVVAVGAALALVGGSVIVSTPAAQAAPRVTIAGSAALGSELTAKVSGGKARSITWQACDAEPAGKSCASGVRVLGKGRTYVVAEPGIYIRVQAQMRSGKGKARKLRSAWIGPMQEGSPGGGGGGTSAPRVGLYMCPGTSFPFFSPATYWSILPGNRYLGPWTTKESTPSRFRVTDGAMYPGGFVLTMVDGPYAGLVDSQRVEYYPAGATVDSETYDVPKMHLVVLPDGYYTEDYHLATCSWISSKPYLEDN